jgi:hypothetical protein
VTLRSPSSPATISPQSSHGYDLAKATLVAIFGVVITVFLKKLAKYFITRLNQPVGAEHAALDTVQPPFLPPADLEEIIIELSPVTLRGPSSLATISPRSSHQSHGYDLAKATTVQPPRLPPADPEGIDLELLVVLPAGN